MDLYLSLRQYLLTEGLRAVFDFDEYDFASPRADEIREPATES